MADILVVDDDQNLAELLRDVFELKGHTVRLAADGQAGLRALDERLPDLVLLDVEMPVLDGPSMAFRMWLEDVGRERVPVVLWSGGCDLARIVTRVGTPYFAGKPCSVEVLVSTIERALRERIPPKPEAR